MKKNFFIAAVAALALASCSNDEVVQSAQTSPDNAISFRPFVSNVTRASSTTDITGPAASGTRDLAKFNVTAYITGTTTSPYINGAVYQYDGSSTFFVDGSSAATNKYANEYYWPATQNLDFYAYSYYGTDWFTASDVTVVGYNTYTFTPSTADDAAYTDFIIATKRNIGKATKYNNDANTYGPDGVPLNFRHTASKIAVKVKNTSAQLKFEVAGWKVGYLNPSGTFTLSENTTDGTGTLALTDWDVTGSTKSVATKYVSTFTSKTIAVNTTTEEALDGEMILVPQRITAATAYANSGTAAVNDDLNGSFIAVKLIIKNNTSDVVIADNGSGGALWAIWPIGDDGTSTFNWEPGKKYTYTIDLAGGGYYEQNNDTDANLDPILDGAIIKFVDVTVDNWDEQTDIPVSGPTL